MNDLANYKLRLDPRIKKGIKETLEQAIYKIVDYRFNERLQEIQKQNNFLAAVYPHRSFHYKGEFYNFEQNAPRFKNQRLHPDLHSLMDAWLADKQQVEYTEKPFIFGLFTKILNTSNSVLDYREMLPECMHAALDSVELEAQHILPRQMDDAQIEVFKEANSEWILMLKRRMILDLIIV